MGQSAEGQNLVAIKLESIGARHPQLLYESKLIKHLQGTPGFPKLYFFGTEPNLKLKPEYLSKQSA